MKGTVIHLVSGRRNTGGAAVALSWHEALRREGVPSLFIYEGGHNLEELLGKREECLLFPRFPRLLKALPAITRGQNVLAHLSNDHWLSALLCRKAHRRFIVAHRVESIKSDALHRWAYGKIEGVIPALQPPLPPLPCPITPWVPPAIDPDLFLPGDQPHRVPVVATIGKLAAERHHEKFLRLARALTVRGVSFRPMIIGKGPHLENLKALARSLDLDVLFAGYKEGGDLVMALQSCDIFVWCSPGSQGAHRALPEAMMAGAVAAAFPMEGTGVWIEDEVTGVDLPEDYEKAAGKIGKILTNPEAMARLREEGMARAREMTQPAAVARRIVSILS